MVIGLECRGKREKEMANRKAQIASFQRASAHAIKTQRQSHPARPLRPLLEYTLL